ncbi:ABC transporter ATP-binding protein, partial [Clavibacter sp. DM3]|nr:ABC transporter ATP-binding protein [Clavibacter zhangzhiyongii]
RVALARALVLEPPLLLLDEPMAALDAGTRLDVRDLLADELRRFGGAGVLVTHDPVDALALADRIHVLEGGRQVQEGAPAEVAARPATAYVARLVGMNRVQGRDAAGGAVVLLAAPADVRLTRGPDALPSDATRARLTGVVRRVEAAAGRIRVTLRLVASAGDAPAAADLVPDAGAEVTAELDAAAFAALRPTAGEELRVTVPRGA